MGIEEKLREKREVVIETAVQLEAQTLRSPTSAPPFQPDTPHPKKYKREPEH